MNHQSEDATLKTGVAEKERAAFEAYGRARPSGCFTLDRYNDPECTDYVHYATQYAWEAWSARSGEAAAAAGEHAQLMKFYGVDSLASLVDVQARSIERLQERLAKAERPFSFAPQRVREG